MEVTNPKIQPATPVIPVTNERIETDGFEGELVIPTSPRGVILLVDGDWGENIRRRTTDLAERLAAARYATLIVEPVMRLGITLVSKDDRPEMTQMAERILTGAKAIKANPDLSTLPFGYFASGVGCAPTMIAAARSPDLVRAIVCSGGRPDLAGISLHRIVSPSLFLVPADEMDLFEMNRWASRRLSCVNRLDIIERQLSDIPAKAYLSEVANRASRWFETHLAGKTDFAKSRSFGMHLPFSRNDDARPSHAGLA
jgi:putative phosphoribosyl transferase